MAVLRAMPVLQVQDLTRSIAFYERLGFECHGTFGDPPAFAVTQRGDVTLAFDLGDGPVPTNQWWAAYIYVDDAGALRDELVRGGIEPASELCEQPYGLVDFDIIDPDGHRIAFGSMIEPGPYAPGLGPERGRG